MRCTNNLTKATVVYISTNINILHKRSIINIITKLESVHSKTTDWHDSCLCSVHRPLRAINAAADLSTFGRNRQE